MKYLIILADGAADEPIPALGDITPLQAANKPNIDRIAREGINGRLITVPQGFHPGSEIAHLGLLGYDVAKVFEGRGSLEAASMKVDIEDNEVAMRCNIICLDGENIKNHSVAFYTMCAICRDWLETHGEDDLKKAGQIGKNARNGEAVK